MTGRPGAAATVEQSKGDGDFSERTTTGLALDFALDFALGLTFLPAYFAGVE